jgi:hypothetical protein
MTNRTKGRVNPSAVVVSQRPANPIHPQHYKNHPSGIECIQVVEWMNFNLGNAIKYIWRSGDKGSALEDLKKAQWYLAREISKLEGKSITERRA